ncbi:hypothetical protein HON22_00540 [Candidatus Peregrinibacteria bacterium]|jgi:hypothetical protein|nr:hypothetical protein [Candidatus Peregrinibacteria bacterium]
MEDQELEEIMAVIDEPTTESEAQSEAVSVYLNPEEEQGLHGIAIASRVSAENIKAVESGIHTSCNNVMQNV